MTALSPSNKTMCNEYATLYILVSGIFLQIAQTWANARVVSDVNPTKTGKIYFHVIFRYA